MNKDIKTRWVAALRSGEYTQTKGYLKTADGYCCLGVLCEIAVQDGIVEQTMTSPEVFTAQGDQLSPEHYAFGEYNDTAELPTVVEEWSGLKDVTTRIENPNYTGWQEFYTLIDLNDDQGYDFNAIADVIEKSF